MVAGCYGGTGSANEWSWGGGLLDYCKGQQIFPVNVVTPFSMTQVLLKDEGCFDRVVRSYNLTVVVELQSAWNIGSLGSQASSGSQVRLLNIGSRCLSNKTFSDR